MSIVPGVLGSLGYCVYGSLIQLPWADSSSAHVGIVSLIKSPKVTTVVVVMDPSRSSVSQGAIVVQSSESRGK